MTNFKQQELIDKLVNEVTFKFPGVKFVSVTESPEDPQDLWVNITFPENEERQIKLMEYAAELETDILLNYGYHIMLMPATKREIALAAKKQKMPI